MTTIAHISDPHFGTEDPVVAAALERELNGETVPLPSVVAVSGDLTQRATTAQFRAARAFLDRLLVPYVVVPGNHDVPLYDVITRFFDPLRRYTRHVTNDLMPTYLDDHVAVLGLATAHGWTLKDGKVTRTQAIEAASWFGDLGDRWKVIIAHHPFVLPAGRPHDELVDGAEEALPILEEAGVAIVCTGHLHVSIGSDEGGFRNEDRRVVAVHAGTCMSTRRRGENNAYNRLRLGADQLDIQQRLWDGERFVDGAHKAYVRVGGKWRHPPEAESIVDAIVRPGPVPTSELRTR